MKNVKNFKNNYFYIFLSFLLVLYNSLEEFDSKLLIRSLIFLTFEQKKTINQLKSNSNNKSMGLSKAPMSSTLKSRLYSLF